MPGIDIDENHNGYVVTSQLTGAREENLIVKNGGEAVHVHAVRNIKKLSWMPMATRSLTRT